MLAMAGGAATPSHRARSFVRQGTAPRHRRRGGSSTSTWARRKRPPDGITFGDVSGGLAIESESAAAFVVGATRPSGPSTGVLVVDANGLFSAANLTTPRAGAAAAWVPGVGLAVAGGSASGAGVEVVGEDLSVKSLAFPADDVTGAAMVLVGEQLVAWSADDAMACLRRRASSIFSVTKCEEARARRPSLRRTSGSRCARRRLSTGAQCGRVTTADARLPGGHRGEDRDGAAARDPLAATRSPPNGTHLA
jgi:hypothetical protein